MASSPNLLGDEEGEPGRDDVGIHGGSAGRQRPSAARPKWEAKPAVTTFEQEGEDSRGEDGRQEVREDSGDGFVHGSGGGGDRVGMASWWGHEREAVTTTPSAAPRVDRSLF